MLTLAAQIFPDTEERCLQVASNIGCLLWHRGIVFKDNCLCHGIAGNGYILHCLSRTFEHFAKYNK